MWTDTSITQWECTCGVNRVRGRAAELLNNGRTLCGGEESAVSSFILLDFSHRYITNI